LTCAGNDFGYEKIFSRFVEAHLRPQDVLLAISTSGKSANVLEAAKAAQTIGAQVVGMTGRPDSPLSEVASPCLVTPGAPSGWADRVQELHIKIIHIWIELIEKGMFE
jgi:D-sedoheptulose 7-phosphate isomerase